MFSAVGFLAHSSQDKGLESKHSFAHGTRKMSMFLNNEIKIWTAACRCNNQDAVPLTRWSEHVWMVWPGKPLVKGFQITAGGYPYII